MSRGGGEKKSTLLKQIQNKYTSPTEMPEEKTVTLNSHSTKQAIFILVSGSLAHKHLTRNMYLYNV